MGDVIEVQPPKPNSVRNLEVQWFRQRDPLWTWAASIRWTAWRGEDQVECRATVETGETCILQAMRVFPHRPEVVHIMRACLATES